MPSAGFRHHHSIGKVIDSISAYQLALVVIGITGGISARCGIGRDIPHGIIGILKVKPQRCIRQIRYLGCGPGIRDIPVGIDSGTDTPVHGIQPQQTIIGKRSVIISALLTDAVNIAVPKKKLLLTT